jgi:hypothetical protein
MVANAQVLLAFIDSRGTDLMLVTRFEPMPGNRPGNTPS